LDFCREYALLLGFTRVRGFIPQTFLILTAAFGTDNDYSGIFLVCKVFFWLQIS
jgi:hypothetical protein